VSRDAAGGRVQAWRTAARLPRGRAGADARPRLRQLQSLFGDALQEPDARFELEIALRARRLLGPADQDDELGILPRRDDVRR